MMGFAAVLKAPMLLLLTLDRTDFLDQNYFKWIQDNAVMARIA